MTSGCSPGEGGTLRAGRGTGLVATVFSLPSTFGPGCLVDYSKDNLANNVNHPIHEIPTPGVPPCPPGREQRNPWCEWILPGYRHRSE